MHAGPDTGRSDDTAAGAGEPGAPSQHAGAPTPHGAALAQNSGPIQHAAPVAPGALRLAGVGKAYRIHARPARALWDQLRGRASGGDFWALRDLGFEVAPGEVIGVIGRNGAGKSTLLQIVCGTLQPTVGEVAVGGRVAALLELGAGFNPEFTGRENIALQGALMGLDADHMRERLDDILAFADIGEHIEQPIKTYSSGMLVRLGFAIATSVDPDLLVIDEALSVGDGAFARKSFDRIMSFKRAGRTILFCSHSLYQVEAFCDRAIWLEGGRLRALGPSREVVTRYADSLLPGPSRGAAAGGGRAVAAGGLADARGEAPSGGAPPSEAPIGDAPIGEDAQAAGGSSGPNATPVPSRPPVETARIVSVQARSGESSGRHFDLVPGAPLTVTVAFESNPELPTPTLGVTLELPDGTVLASFVSRTDGVALVRDARGSGEATVEIAHLPLRKGDYSVGIYLACERAIHYYDVALQTVLLHVSDPWPEPGKVSIDHAWRIGARD